MNFASSLLAFLGGSVERAQADVKDTDIQVPNVLLPVVSLPEAMLYGLSTGAGAGITLGAQTTSHMFGYSATRAAGAGAITDRFMHLGSGLWELSITFSGNVSNLTNQFAVQAAIITPSGSGGGQWNPLLHSTPAASVVVNQAFNGRVLIYRGHTMTMTALLDNTAGGAPIQLSVGGFANKLA